MSQSVPGSNGNEAGDSIFPKDPDLEPLHQIQFNVIPRTLFFFEGPYLLCRRYSQYIF